jgi:hypothetical protein
MGAALANTRLLAFQAVRVGLLIGVLAATNQRPVARQRGPLGLASDLRSFLRREAMRVRGPPAAAARPLRTGAGLCATVWQRRPRQGSRFMRYTCTT